jgi:hypothetical protein
LLVGASLVIAALVAFRWWWPDEETRIAARLHELARLATPEEDESPLSRVAAVAQLRSFFAEDVTIARGEGVASISGRDELLAVAAQVRASVARLAFADVQVHLEGTDSASAYLTATVSRRARSAGAIEAREVQLSLRKQDGNWVITRIEPLSTLERR